MKSYVFIFLLLIAVAGCKSTETSAPVSPNSGMASTPTPAAVGNPAASSTNSASPVKSEIDACNLLSGDDLRSIQGEAYKEAQRSDREDKGLVISQCYYQMPNMANSIVLNVTTPKRGGVSRLPGLFWEETFHQDVEKDRDANRDHDRKREKPSVRGEEEEEGAPPERIKGLGQEAFWSASQVGGALYVKRDEQIFFRISIGGADNASTKLNKSKRLAQLILKKLGPVVREG
jgi:hypothetical protein